MTAPNHIAGGIFFAGFWTSFWNINIFDRPQYIAVAIFYSLLPDIDHPGSTIGLPFYPISKFINRKYGHRTLTHSLLFLSLATVTTLLLEKAILPPGWSGITIISYFAFLSHLLIDMLTIAGVPLLYPFRRNPCVIPGKAAYRMRSGNFKSELTAFLIFCSLNFLCFDLYRDGFWFTYNHAFSTIQHVHYERANSPNFTLCSYAFVQQGKEFRGLAPVVESEESSLALLIDGKITNLNYKTPGLVLKEVKPVKTNFPFKYITKSFSTDSIKTLNAFFLNRIIKGFIQANTPFILQYCKPNANGLEESKTGSSAELTNFTNVAISISPATIEEKKNILKQIAIKKQSLIQDKINFKKTNAEYFALRGQEKQLRENLPAALNISERNAIENDLIKIRNKLQFLQDPVYTDNTVTLETIRQLYLQLHQLSAIQQHFTATLSYLDVPDSLITLSKQSSLP